jgi:enoyl-[acyl-carrier protein] reductase I
MSDQVLAGKVGVVFGVANKRSIAWAIAQAWAKAGAKLMFNYQGRAPEGERGGSWWARFGEETLHCGLAT